jgi:hypothetical protein
MVYKSLANGDLNAIDQRIQLISDPAEAKLFARMFAPDLNTIKKKPQGIEPDVPNSQPQDEADLDAILKGMSEEPEASPSNPAPVETRPQGLEPLEMIKNRYPQIDPFLIEGIAKTIAVMRHHRACILHDLGRFDEWERDHTWLELFGFEDTAKLK